MTASNLPFISILIPTRNEEEHIRACLESVLAQDYPPGRVEILVADGMSVDRTREIVRAFQGGTIPITIVDNPGRITPTGLNAALLRSKGEIIVRVDGHTRIAPDYVRQCVNALQRSGADNAGGRMDAESATSFGRAVACATSSPFGVGSARFHYSEREEWVDTVYMGAWPRRVFSKIGLFDEELVRDQDDEFNYRLRAGGGKILLSPGIKSVYSNRADLPSLWRQYFQYGYWKVRVLQKHPRQMSLRQFVPPAFVLALLGSLLAALGYRPAWPAAAAVIACYLLANLGASCLAARRKGWGVLALLPLVYAILHLSYGLGFLVGLVKFANRWGDRQGKVPVFTSDHA